MPRRRAKGEGSVTEYRKGHYRAFLDLGKDPITGKRIRKSFTGGSKAEVIAKLNKAKYEKQEGLLTITEKTPMRQYCLHWLSVRKTNIKGSSYIAYKSLIDNHVIPALGDKSISEIDVIDLNSFFGNLKVSKTYQNKIKVVMHNIFKLAIKEELLTSNPIDLLDPIKVTKKEIKALTVDEVKTLLTTAKAFNPFYYLIKLTLETGLRRGEVLGLHWSDINFETTTITIKRNVVLEGSIQTVGEPKTLSSRRTLSVSKETLQELLAIKKDDCDIVFSNAGGLYMDPSRVYKTFKKIVKQAGLRGDIRFHDLRHTNATLLIAKGVNMKTVSERLGHSSITITMDRYTHGVLEEDQKAAKIINNIIK